MAFKKNLKNLIKIASLLGAESTPADVRVALRLLGKPVKRKLTKRRMAQRFPTSGFSPEEIKILRVLGYA